MGFMKYLVKNSMKYSMLVFIHGARRQRGIFDHPESILPRHMVADKFKEIFPEMDHSE